MSFFGGVFCKFFWCCFVSSLGATPFPPRGSIGLGLTNSLVTPFLDLKSMMLPFISRGRSSEDSRRAPEQQPRSQGQENSQVPFGVTDLAYRSCSTPSTEVFVNSKFLTLLANDSSLDNWLGGPELY